MYKLSELNHDSFAGDHPVALDGDQTIPWSQFIVDINSARAHIGTDKRAEWALFQADSYTFAVWLIALLAENKTVYLPGENHAAITADLKAQQINLIGQFPDASSHNIALGESSGPGLNFSLSGCIVVYTSGSTGAAKPILKTLSQLDSELLALESTWGTNWNNPVVAGTVSHQHFYGLLFSLLWPLCSGRRFCRKPFIDPAIMANTIDKNSHAVWIMSPAHLHRMPINMPWDRVREKIGAVFSSGGPLQQHAAQAIYERLGQYPVEVLGSSETGGIASRQQFTASTSWQPLPGVDVRVDKQGVLTVRSPWLEEEDWYVTSDLATLSDEGGFKLGMRADRIVKLEGKRVALPEIESVLIGHPWISEAVAVVVSRQRQALGAVLVLTELGCIAEKETGRHEFTTALRQYLRRRVSSAAIPRFWRISPGLQKNAQGKILIKTALALFNPTLPTIINHKSEENKCILNLQIDSDNPYFNGHFPGQPVLAGVVQLLWAQHFGREFLGLTGEFSGMKAIKFRQLVFPGRGLCLNLEFLQESGRLKFHYQSNDGNHSQGMLLYEAKA